MPTNQHAPAGVICRCNLPGWMPGVEHVPMQWSRQSWVVAREGKMQPRAIVDHIMQGYLSTMVDWARNGGRRITAHFGISPDRIVQFESIFTPGIHASTVVLSAPQTAPIVKALGANAGVNGYTIGIEHEGCSVDPRPAYTVPARMVYSAGNPWPTTMVANSIAVKRWCFEHAPTLGTPRREAVIGHYETGDPNRVNDPAAAADRSVWPVQHMLEVLARDVTGPTYRVQPGDFLGRIAQQQGVTVDQLVAWNGLVVPNRIEVGQVLRLRPPGDAPAAEPAPAPPPPPPAATVQVRVLGTEVVDDGIAQEPGGVWVHTTRVVTRMRIE